MINMKKMKRPLAPCETRLHLLECLERRGFALHLAGACLYKHHAKWVARIRKMLDPNNPTGHHSQVTGHQQPIAELLLRRRLVRDCSRDVVEVAGHQMEEVARAPLGVHRPTRASGDDPEGVERIEGARRRR